MPNLIFHLNNKVMIETAYTQQELNKLLTMWMERRDKMVANILDANKPHASIECISQARRHVSKITELNQCINELAQFMGMEVGDE